MADTGQKILATMLERLYSSLVSGPVLNCRPHSSRQRIDLTAVARLGGQGASDIVEALFGESRTVKLTPSAHRPSDAVMAAQIDTLDPSARAAREAWDGQQATLSRLRTIAEDARTYEQDTGSAVLYVGLPLLHMPPETARRGASGAARRILAPVAFVPVQLVVKTTRPASVSITCTGDGVDRVIPNAALLAWIEQQTGTRLPERFDDDEGTQPQREVVELVAQVCNALRLPVPAAADGLATIEPTPRTDSDESRSPGIVGSAVLGLFPVSNQSLLRDMQALVDGEPAHGPIEAFLRVQQGFGDHPSATSPRIDDRLVSDADPCQARAVRLARDRRGLVIHGPPGTGKSQTITNIIGDHVARGERVLFVCEKRTALDVVEHRLGHLGLSGLCAIVHDAQRDQRGLYKSIREQLEALPDAKTDAGAAGDVAALDDQLERLHASLSAHDRALAERPDGGTGTSFHELVGRWLAIEAGEDGEHDGEIRGVPVRTLPALESDVREVLDRGAREGLGSNPWEPALGLKLATYLARPETHWRGIIATLRDHARDADATRSDDVPTFAPDADVIAEAGARNTVAERLAPILSRVDPRQVARWARKPLTEIERARQSIAAIAPQRELLERARPDPEIATLVRSDTPSLALAVEWLGALLAYLAIARKWYRWFCFGRKRGAALVLRRLGLAFEAVSAERAAAFLGAFRARKVLEDCRAQLAPGERPTTLGDAELSERTRADEDMLALLADVHTEPALGAGRVAILERLADPATHAGLIAGLRASPGRAAALARFERSLEDSGLFGADWLRDTRASLRAGSSVLPALVALDERRASIEGLLRIREALGRLPHAVAERTTLLAGRAISADDGWRDVQKSVLAGEIAARLADAPVLLEWDAERLRAAHESFAALEARRRDRVRDAVLHHWNTRQKQRLLATTGSRLNGPGADMRRRLALRGESALRVRQVIAAGSEIEGGDPLFDLRPVWMASPDTVAQIFPRAPIFDVVIFDEASQCRLEEALPVLLRAHRVVIAGDPKQLPPTRFFESSVAQSHDPDADTSEQGLFEEQQSDTEDLLGAALNLEIEQSYLDVHYRSHNADLIEFSNQNFYDARLQAIPGHPRHRAMAPPIRLVRVNGVYDQRANAIEAREVVRIVRDLLARPSPPSIGIACFNLVQRDEIVDALEEGGAEDPAFAARLATARARQGASSFEGLFVKNLENVQGDERDHMIVSTTYGPDPKGKFHRRFGPLALAGGGRRLNVLITRARQEVHLVTSIPPEAYRSKPTLAAGSAPNGAWLLFAYIEHAEQLEQRYRDEAVRRATRQLAKSASVIENDTNFPSPVALSLAHRLASGAESSIVHWGNDGFCVDIALVHPQRTDDFTLGVLCDGSRFEKAGDRVRWDLFRSGVLARQGWQLVRVLSPQVFRNPEGAVAALRTAVAAEVVREARTEPARDSLPSN